jgi:Galactose oxidase, central domain/Kelch motif
MMRDPQEIRAIRSASVVVIAGALAVMFFAAHRDRSAPVANRASSSVAAAHESRAFVAASEEPATTLINLPGPTQAEQIAESDTDNEIEPVAIPLYDARMSINPAVLTAQQLAAERGAFIAVGSPGPVTPAIGAGQAGAGAASAANSNASGLLLGFAQRTAPMGSRRGSAAVGHAGWVLIAGGQGGGKIALTRAELFDPNQMNFVTTGAMHWPRAHFVAAELSAGQTLVAGGDDAQGHPISSAELYDPIAGQFSSTGAMTVPRAGHTATAISGCGCAADGKILIAGGSSTDASVPLASAELFDPATGSFNATGSLSQARAWHTASLISTGAQAGDILIAGGVGAKAIALASAEIYDPRTGAFTATGSMATARAYQTATWLDPSIVTGEFAGQILIAGGWSGDSISDTAEVYDPAGEAFVPAGTMTSARAYQTAVLMPNGKVLIAGGQCRGDALLATAEIFDPVKETFTATSPMRSVHAGGVASILPDSSVLIAGGRSVNAEVYSPATGNFTLTAAMPVDVAYAAGAVVGH